MKLAASSLARCIPLPFKTLSKEQQIWFQNHPPYCKCRRGKFQVRCYLATHYEEFLYECPDCKTKYNLITASLNLACSKSLSDRLRIFYVQIRNKN